MGATSGTAYENPFIDEAIGNNLTFYYRAWFTYTWQGTLHNSPYSNVAFVHVDCAGEGPELIASCRPDRIVLKWTAPDWIIQDDDLYIEDWTLMRATDPFGPYEPLQLGSDYSEMSGGLYVDSSIVSGTTYYYHVSFTYFNWWIPDIRSSAYSKIAIASTCDTPTLGPIDVAFVWDNTQSDVKHALDKLKADPSLIDLFLDDIDDSSGGDYRLALVSTDTDIVNVRVPFASGNRASFKTALTNLPSVTGGGSFLESTDECLNTVVNGLWACHRDPNVDPPQQIGDFSPPFGRQPTGGTWFLGDLNNQTNPMAFDISPSQLEVELGLLWSINSVTGQSGREYFIEFSTAPNDFFGDASGLSPASKVVVTSLDAVSYLVRLEQNVRKVVVLLTDDLPGGFGGIFTPEVKENAEKYAQMARCNDSASMPSWSTRCSRNSRRRLCSITLP